MQILSIHLRNIKSHSDTLLSFSPGINILSGPNGAGKSTVFEAIGYALFGVDACDFVTNIGRFLSIGAKRGEVAVVFRTSAGETWRASRTVGAPVKWLLAREINGLFEVEEHARLEETEARIAELLELNNGRPLAEQFKLVIGPFQNEFLGPFIIKQPTKRIEAFDEILGIDAWRKTYKGTGALLKAIENRAAILAVEVAGKQEQLLVLPEKNRELEAARNSTLAGNREFLEKEAALLSLDGRLTEMLAVEKAITALANEVELLENRCKDGAGKIEEQKLRVAESRQAQQTVAGSKAGKEAFDKAEALLGELRQKEQQRRIVEQEISLLEKSLLTVSQKLTHENTEIAKIDAQLTAEQERLTTARRQLQPDGKLTKLADKLPGIRKEIDLLKGEQALLAARRESLLEGKEKLSEGVCPFFQEQCKNIAGAAPRDVFSSRVSELDTQIAALADKLNAADLQLQEAEAAEKEVNSRTARLQELEKQATVLQDRCCANKERAAGLAALEEQQTGAARLVAERKTDLQAFSGLDEEIARAEQERQQHQSAKESHTANLNVAQDLDNRQESLRKMLVLLETLTADSNARQTELASQREGYQPEQLLQTRKEKELLLSATAALRQQLSDLDRTRERLERESAQLKLLQEDIGRKLLEISEFEEKSRLVKFLRNQVFKNVSTQLSERFREEISLRADRIYRTIAETDEELYWGDNYQIILKDMQAGTVRERSDDQLSGGQTMSAVVALRLALLQTIGARIAFFDEPTSNLDAARRENLARAFHAIDVGREEVTEHWYDQLFLISHDVAFTEITEQMIELGRVNPDL